MRGAPGMGFVPLQVEEGTRNLSLLGHVRTHTPTSPEARSHQTWDLPASSPQTPSLGAMRHEYLFLKPPVCGILLQQSPSRFRHSVRNFSLPPSVEGGWQDEGPIPVSFQKLRGLHPLSRSDGV